MRGGAVGNAGDLGAVRQADLVTRVASGLHLIHHVDGARIGNSERQPRGAGAVVKRDVLGESGAAGHLGGRALVVHVERGRQVGALGVHRVHERERVGTRHEVDRVLVHRDGVLDVGAVGHLLGRLLHDLVRGLDGLETGGERLRASLGVGLVGELHGSTGIAQCRAVHGSLILKLNVIVNVSLDTLDVRLHGEDGGGALAGRLGGQRRPMANRAVVAAMQVVPGAARHIHHALGHLVGDDDVDVAQGAGRGGGPPVGLHLVDKNRPVGDPGAPLGGAGLNLAPAEVGVPVHVAVLGDFRRLIGLDGEARLGRLGHRGRPEGGLVRIGVVGAVTLGTVGYRHIGGTDEGTHRIACYKGKLELVPLAIVCDPVVNALNELIVACHELELVKRSALVLAGIELVGKGHLRRVGVGRHARHEDRGLPGGVAVGGGSLRAHELLGDVLGVVGRNEAGRRIALRALPVGVLDGELVVHRVLGGGVGHLGVVHDGVRLLAGVGAKGIAEARAVGGQRTRGDGCAGSILDLVAALVGMTHAKRVGKDIAGHVSLERTRVDRGRPGDVVRGARALLACHVDGKPGAGGTDVVLVVLAVGAPRPAGRVVHAGKLAAIGDRLPCIGRDGRGVGQRVATLRKVAQVERGGLTVHGRSRRELVAVKLERCPVERKVGANRVDQHDVRRLGGNVELNGPRHRVALGVNGTPLGARHVAVLERERDDTGNAGELDLNLIGIVASVRVQLHLEVDAQRDARRVLLEPLLGIGNIEHAVGDGPRRLVGTALVVELGVANVGHRDVRREHVVQARGPRGEHALVDAALNLAVHFRVRRDRLALPGPFTVIGDFDLHAIRREVIDGYMRGVGVISSRGDRAILGAGGLFACQGGGIAGSLGRLLGASCIGRDVCRAGIGGRTSCVTCAGVVGAVGCVVARRRGCVCSVLIIGSRRLTCSLGDIYLLGSNHRARGSHLLRPRRRHPTRQILEHQDCAEKQRQDAAPHRNRHRSTSFPHSLRPHQKAPLSVPFLAMCVWQTSSNSSLAKRQNNISDLRPIYRISIHGPHVGRVEQV